MKKAYNKDIFRSLKKGKKRFLSIMLITALGVMMATGIRAACTDLRISADRFYDEQNLFDISIVSTMGLTQDDLSALKELPEVQEVQGDYSATVSTRNGEKNKSVSMKTFEEGGINLPYVQQGTLPTADTQIAVTQNYSKDTGKGVGDTVTVDLMDSAFTNDQYEISAIVTDAADVNNSDGAVAFRSTATTDYTFFVTPQAVDSDVYTAIYLTVGDTKDLNSYSDAYDDRINEVTAIIDTQLKEDRQLARLMELTAPAYEEIDKAETEMLQKFDDAESQLDQAEMLMNAQGNVSQTSMAQAGAAFGNASQSAAVVKLEEQRQELARQKEEAQEEIEDSRQQVSETPVPQWYIQDRSSLSGYGNVKSDAASIETIGTIFPILFLTVAILISLTTITRMVEEDRGLIGTYKALGFSDGEIRKKYLIYAVSACLLGGIIGDLGGFILLPEIMFVIFQTMYQLPAYVLTFHLLNGFGAILLFLAGIIIATYYSCRTELRQLPSALMRPKAPHAGSRVFLEHIGPLWRRMSFLNKVTARNLFRYKKRLLMTVAGILGCSALLVCGFAIKDSVTDLMPRQYEQTYQYDLMAVAADGQNDVLLDNLSDESQVDAFINVRIESVKIKNADGREEKVQLIVVPQEAVEKNELKDYIHLESTDGEEVNLGDTGIVVTRNAGDVLNFQAGDSVTLQTLKLQEHTASVDALVKNYLGNNVYLSQQAYEEMFGSFEPNGVLVNLSADCVDQGAFADELGGKDGVLSSVSTQELKEEFTSAFALINMVVYIIIIMAAALAFTVLFTLATTNISERQRELATIKVLGFYDREVHLYVNKETLILTGMGILLGLPAGCALGHCLTYALNMPSIYFAVSIHPSSYLLAAGIALLFAVLVDLLIDRSLDVIDPIEALKSIE